MRPVRALLAVAALAAAGCGTTGPLVEPGLAGLPSSVELESTPFFPQAEYQCGPAALATVLTHAGVPTDPLVLAPEVYLPGREGSLQPELVAATRARDRVPYVLPPRPESLYEQVAAGTPVLVLQKLGAGPWPGWHYAVVVGYDAGRGTVTLRSGTNRRLEESAERFLLTWDRAGRWAMVALPPGSLPANPDFARYMEAAAGLEAVGRTDAAARAYEAAAAQWPDAALPLVGLANLAYARGDLPAAEAGFRAATERAPDDVAGRNNRAQVLLELGCPAAARAEIAVAQALAADGPLASAVAASAVRIAATHGPDAPGCPAD